MSENLEEHKKNAIILNKNDEYKIGKIKYRIDSNLYKNYDRITSYNEEHYLLILKCYKNFIRIVSSRKMNDFFCGMGTTLLGSYLNKGFLPHEDRIELMIFEELHNDIVENIDIYNSLITPFVFYNNWIGLKLYFKNTCLIDLFLFSELENHYIPSGPKINGKLNYFVYYKYPFCKFHKDVIFPISKEFGYLENLKINVPNNIEKYLEIYYTDQYKKNIIIDPRMEDYDYFNIDNLNIVKVQDYLLDNYMTKIGKKISEKIPDYIYNIKNYIYDPRKIENNTNRGKKKCSITIGAFDVLHHGHEDLLNLMNENKYKIILIFTDKIVEAIVGKKTVDSLDKRINNIIKFYEEKGESNNVKIYPVYNFDPLDVLEVVFSQFLYIYDFIYYRGNDTENFLGKSFLEENFIPIVYKEYFSDFSKII